MTRLEPEEVIDFVDSALNSTLPEPNETFKIGDNEFLRPKDMDAPLIDVKLAPLVSCARSALFSSATSCRLSQSASTPPSRFCSVRFCAVTCSCPFSWHHIFIPIVPASLLSYVTAPMPFLVGIKRSLQPTMEKLPMEACVYVDVDKGEIAYSESDPIIDLYPKNTISTGSMGGVGKSVSTVSEGGRCER